MKCFYHPPVDAVGICKNCQRGLCPGCASERDGGLACRDTGDKRYSVLVNPIGLILIYGSDGVVIGRRAAPEGFVASNGIHLAIACVAGNLDPFTIAVYVNDELVAEVQQEQASASEGLGGMFAQAFGAGASVSFDDFRVLVEPN